MGAVHMLPSGADWRIKSQAGCLLYSFSGSHGAEEVKIERSGKKNGIVDTLSTDITPENVCGVL